MKKDGLLECSRKCMELKACCPNEDCRYWIDYKDENNCTLVSIYQNGPMTLDEVSKRLKISLVRVSQIEKEAMKKLSKRIKL